MTGPACYHCGEPAASDAVEFDGRTFCCPGCRTVYDLLKSHDLGYYYELEQAAGKSPASGEGAYDYLDDPEIAGRLLDFQDTGHHVISLSIPHIHCSSCIWILENLHKLNPGVISSQVDFPRKKARIHFNPELLSLKALVGLLAGIGYEPSITLDDYSGAGEKKDRTLIYQLAIAGFAFGNIMFLSFPEYFESGEYWLEKYKVLFRWLMFSFSVPVVFYSGMGYLRTAWKGLRSGLLNIDLPIALGILTLFLRSTVEIAWDLGSGYFDSLAGLVFFLLLGRFFQQRTYAHLSFERDYKSYFPIAVTRIGPDGTETNVPVYEISPGDRVLIRNNSLIPADCVLLSGTGQIDYSFVTGEARPVAKKAGDTLYAGGKQLQGPIEVRVQREVSQSYLTELWSDSAFSGQARSSFRNFTDRIGKRFTLAVLSIATVAAGIWLAIDPGRALDVFTAVLIIACPCAIALAAPFTLGNLLRIFGRNGFYAKDTNALERMASTDTILFDKTGTISTTRKNQISYKGIPLEPGEARVLKNLLRASGHPLSQTLYRQLAPLGIVPLDHFQEHLGEGLEGGAEGHYFKVGSRGFVQDETSVPETEATHTSATEKNAAESAGAQVHVRTAAGYRGCFNIRNAYREGADGLFRRLAPRYELAVLSGDNASEKEALEALLPPLTPAYFNQQPADKLHFVRELQQNGRQVAMVGDGLNDAGALAQAEVGIAVSEDANLFTPACDAILDSRHFTRLDAFLGLTRKAMGIIRVSLALSLMYNAVGLWFAVTGRLEPVVAAILMPLSSISIVAFTTAATNWICRKLDGSKSGPVEN